MVDNIKLLPEMEVFRTENYYVLLNTESSLWCDRKTGGLEVKPAWELANSGDPECLGIFYGLVGKVDFKADGEGRLMLIKDTEQVGKLPDGRDVVKIRSVTFLHICGPDVTVGDLGLKPCKKHKGGYTGNIFEVSQKASLAKTWGSIKSATSSIKSSTQQAAAMATYQVKSGTKKDTKDRDRFEKRILDELSRVFTETDSFYFCRGPPGSKESDLTNCQQKENSSESSTDERFFWNKYMLHDLIEINNNLAKSWILPIIQGYVQIEHCNLEFEGSNFAAPHSELVTIGIVSRRSRYRAGTRYKRRGLDEDGKCANYVETEQFVATRDHYMSFIQVRGSVPLFWSQPGYKYRPPPHIDKGEAENKAAFEKHMEEEIGRYSKICIVNLVEQTGKEKVIWDGFTQHVLQYNSEDITYATFDFHEHCRGMRFENVTFLINKLEDVIQDMGFSWKDKQGIICKQNGVFRVNCIDCLDRTNVVQTAIGKAMLELMLTKLGLLPPEGNLPDSLRVTFQLLWANNGDIISKQYAGTNALKGDYTRTGERKFTGMMKDGMNSANRYLRRLLMDEVRQAAIDVCQGIDYSMPSHCCLYAQDTLELLASPVYTSSLPLEQELLMGIAAYHFTRYYLSRFKDVYRQATIDIMQGNLVTEDILTSGEDDTDSAATAEHVKLLIEDCKKLLISDSSLILGAWGLINADPTRDPTETDMDTILILTRESYYVADYDDDLDVIVKFQRIPLNNIVMVELGPSDFTSTNSPLQIFNKAKKSSQYCLRIRYRLEEVGDVFAHTFRSSNLRFFNNVAVVIKSEDEATESLKAICDCIKVALEICQEYDVQWHIGTPLSKINLPNSIFPYPQITRNTSETQLENFKSAGSKAIHNVSSKFSKIGNVLNPKKKNSALQKEDVQKSDVENEDNSVDVCSEKNDSKDTFLPNVGIVMSNTTINEVDPDDVIIITSDDDKPKSIIKPSELKVRTFSHSSSEVDDKDHLKPTDLSSGNKLELSLGSITSSQSENALRSIKTGFSTATNVLTSPSASAAAVLSPLTKLAKGMQSLSANLDIRRLKQVRTTSYQASAETNHLKELWESEGCKSKLIAV